MSSNGKKRQLEGKIALITGGSRGIGLAISIELARRGASICFNYLKNHNAASNAEKKLNELGVKTLKLRTHLGDEQSIKELITSVQNEFGKLDILVNNAASGVMKPSAELGVHHWDWTMNINARAPWLTTRGFAKIMPRGSKVINISSPGSSKVIPSYFAVGVSKSALESITRYMAIEMAELGISVNAVSPGFIMTDAIKAFPSELSIEKLAARPTPTGKNVQSQDVANVVAMLCGEDAEMIRGHVIIVDGGETLLVH